MPGLVASLVGGIIDFVAGIGTILIGALTLNETKIKKGMHLAVGGLLSTVGLKEAFTEKWVPGPTGGKLPDSLSNDLEEVEQNVPKDAYKNGMHAWHAGSNAALANKLGPVGSIFVFLGGIFHESPLDWGSFKAEQHFQGTVNHILDSITDIIANVFGIILGLLLPKKLATKLAIKLGNHIPGPGDPDPAFGGDGAYRGNPTKAWGQYPRL